MVVLPYLVGIILGLASVFVTARLLRLYIQVQVREILAESISPVLPKLLIEHLGKPETRRQILDATVNAQWREEINASHTRMETHLQAFEADFRREMDATLREMVLAARVRGLHVTVATEKEAELLRDAAGLHIDVSSGGGSLWQRLTWEPTDAPEPPPEPAPEPKKRARKRKSSV